MNPREQATVLAALRLWQSKIGPDNLPAQANTAQDFGPFFADSKPLTRKQIDSLCERLNTKPALVHVFMEGGLIQNIETPSGVRVMVYDYDVEGVDAERITQDGKDDDCTITEWGKQ